MSIGSVTDEGKPHIVDRCGQRQMPIGIESFEDVLRDFVYVDKTLAVKDLIDRRGVTLFCRPRRFGESTFLRMLQCFFECPEPGHVPDRKGLFDGLAISGEKGRYLTHNCTHHAIYLNLAGCGAPSFEGELEGLARCCRR